jgi:hypothetical protein
MTHTTILCIPYIKETDQKLPVGTQKYKDILHVVLATWNIRSYNCSL